MKEDFHVVTLLRPLIVENTVEDGSKLNFELQQFSCNVYMQRSVSDFTIQIV